MPTLPARAARPLTGSRNTDPSCGAAIWRPRARTCRRQVDRLERLLVRAAGAAPAGRGFDLGIGTSSHRQSGPRNCGAVRRSFLNPVQRNEELRPTGPEVVATGRGHRRVIVGTSCAHLTYRAMTERIRGGGTNSPPALFRPRAGSGCFDNAHEVERRSDETITIPPSDDGLFHRENRHRQHQTGAERHRTRPRGILREPAILAEWAPCAVSRDRALEDLAAVADSCSTLP